MWYIDKWIKISINILTGESSKFTGGRLRGKRNELKIDKIKNLLTNWGSPNQQLLTINAVLKDPIFSKENDKADVVNIDNDSPITVYLLKRIK